MGLVPHDGDVAAEVGGVGVVVVQVQQLQPSVGAVAAGQSARHEPVPADAAVAELGVAVVGRHPRQDVRGREVVDLDGDHVGVTW